MLIREHLQSDLHLITRSIPADRRTPDIQDALDRLAAFIAQADAPDEDRIIGQIVWNTDPDGKLHVPPDRRIAWTMMTVNLADARTGHAARFGLYRLFSG